LALTWIIPGHRAQRLMVMSNVCQFDDACDDGVWFLLVYSRTYSFWSLLSRWSRIYLTQILRRINTEAALTIRHQKAMIENENVHQREAT
jgi:hypothetical protein